MEHSQKIQNSLPSGQNTTNNNMFDDTVTPQPQFGPHFVSQIVSQVLSQLPTQLPTLIPTSPPQSQVLTQSQSAIPNPSISPSTENQGHNMPLSPPTHTTLDNVNWEQPITAASTTNQVPEPSKINTSSNELSRNRKRKNNDRNCSSENRFSLLTQEKSGASESENENESITYIEQQYSLIKNLEGNSVDDGEGFQEVKSKRQKTAFHDKIENKKENGLENKVNIEGQRIMYFTFSLLHTNIFPTEKATLLAKAFFKFLGEHCSVHPPKGPWGPCFAIREGLINKAKRFNWDNLNLPKMVLRIDPYIPHSTSDKQRKKFYLQEKNKSTKTQASVTGEKAAAESKGIIDWQIGESLEQINNALNFAKNQISNAIKLTDRFGKFTGQILLTFKTAIPPLMIIGNLYNTQVKPALLNIIRCNNCQNFGHRTDSCKSKKKVCPHCAGPHTHSQCQMRNQPYKLKCSNCKGNHGAYNKACPSYQKYKTIIDNKNNEIRKKWQERILKSTNTDLQADQVKPKNEENKKNEQKIEKTSTNEYISKLEMRNILMEILDKKNLELLINQSSNEKAKTLDNIINKNWTSIGQSTPEKENKKTETDNEVHMIENENKESNPGSLLEMENLVDKTIKKVISGEVSVGKENNSIKSRTHPKSKHKVNANTVRENCRQQAKESKEKNRQSKINENRQLEDTEATKNLVALMDLEIPPPQNYCRVANSPIKKSI